MKLPKKEIKERKFILVPVKYIIISLFFIILFFLLIASVLRESPVFDEIAFAPAGYEFLVKHDFTAEPFSPPLTREIIALPMLINKNVINDKVFFYPRMVVVLFTLLLGIVVYLFSNKLYGIKAAIFSLLLFTFEPEILARGHIAMTDLITTFFFTLSLYLFYIFRKSFDHKKLILFSIVVGLTLSTKFTMLPFLFVTLGSFIIFEKKKKLLNFNFWKKKAGFIFIFISLVFISLWSTYFFTFEPPLGYRADPNRAAIEMAKKNVMIKWALTQPVPLGSYLSTIKEDLRENYTNDFIKESYFFGKYSLYGFYGYYQMASFLIKTPIPLIIFFVLSLYYFFRKKDSYFPLIPIIVIFLSTSFTHVLLVLRYILPVYPFLIIYASQIVNVKKNKFVIVLIAILTIWYIAGTLKVFPHYISYYNEIVGGEKNGYKYLVEGNMDLGQGLVDLATYQKEKNINNLQLAYFGTALPSRYGIRYERIKDKSIFESKKVRPMNINNNIVAISATCWHFCFYDSNEVLKNLKPVDIVGGSILIFKK